MCKKRYSIFIVVIVILILFASTVSVFATDITISETSIPGIQPQGLVLPRALTNVSVTDGSPNISCTNCFIDAMVGMTGFTISLNNVNYSDVTITSTTTAVLGSSYVGTTGLVAGVFYPYVILRWYSTSAFQPKGSTTIIQPGTVGSRGYYKQYAASVIGTVLYIKTMVVPATTDATLNNQVRWVLGMYLPNGANLNVVICPSQVTQWAIPANTPTTLLAICGYNYPPANVPPNNEAYTKPQIDARFPSCNPNQSAYYKVAGNIQTCLTYGSGLQLSSGGILTATGGGGGGGYSQVMKDAVPLTARGSLNFIGTGLTAEDNATLLSTDIGLNANLNALAANTTNGFWARTGSGTGAARTLVAPASGFTIADANGVAGNPTFALSGNLAGLEGLSGIGLAARIGANSWIERTLTAASSDVTVTNGSGVAGNPTIGLAANVARLNTAQNWTGVQTFNAGNLNIGPAASDPATPTAGVLYFNTGTGLPKYYNGTAWVSIQGVTGNVAFLDVAQNWTARQTFNAGNLNVGPAASDPATPNAGVLYFNTTTGLPKYYNGTTWVSIQGVVGNVAYLDVAQNWTAKQTFNPGNLNVGVSVTAPATPAVGDVYFNNTLTNAPAFYDGTAWRYSPTVLYSAYPNTTLTTTAATVTTIPANRLDIVGSAIKITMAGTYTTTASADIGVTISINGTAFNHFTINGASTGTGTWTYAGQLTRYSATNMISLGSFNVANATFFNFSLSTIRNSNDFAMATGVQNIQVHCLTTTSISLTLKHAHIVYYPTPQ